MAKPGEVLLGPTTYDSVKDRIEAETLEPVTLKGIIDQIRPYRVIDCEL
jgi:class 3 adenylate cyclase